MWCLIDVIKLNKYFSCFSDPFARFSSFFMDLSETFDDWRQQKSNEILRHITNELRFYHRMKIKHKINFKRMLMTMVEAVFFVLFLIVTVFVLFSEINAFTSSMCRISCTLLRKTNITLFIRLFVDSHLHLNTKRKIICYDFYFSSYFSDIIFLFLHADRHSFWVVRVVCFFISN